MNIIIKKDGTQNIKQIFHGTVKELLNKLKLNPEAYLVAKNNEIVDEDEQLEDTDTITIFSVVSGG